MILVVGEQHTKTTGEENGDLQPEVLLWVRRSQWTQVRLVDDPFRLSVTHAREDGFVEPTQSGLRFERASSLNACWPARTPSPRGGQHARRRRHGVPLVQGQRAAIAWSLSNGSRRFARAVPSASTLRPSVLARLRAGFRAPPPDETGIGWPLEASTPCDTIYSTATAV
jgi:hypothetical protein